MQIKRITKTAILAAIYVVLTIALGEFSYGPIQFRISEALVILPLVEPSAIIGVFLGCMISNIFGGYGLIDIIGGSLVTLLAAYLTSKMPNKLLAALPPIILNAFIIPIWLAKLTNIPYIIIAINIAIGEILAVGVLGVTMLSIYDKYLHSK